MSWQPIETAPKDGTKILLFSPGWTAADVAGYINTGSWGEYINTGDWGWSDGNGYALEGRKETHWMPLPEPPA